MWNGGGEELVGIKEIIPPPPFTPGPQRTILFRIKHQNFVGTIQFFKIDRETPPTPPSLGQEWERPFGMGGTDKPLLAVSIASKVLLQHDDSAIPGTMRTTRPHNWEQLISWLLCLKVPPLLGQNPLSRNYSYLQQVPTNQPVSPCFHKNGQF